MPSCIIFFQSVVCFTRTFGDTLLVQMADSFLSRLYATSYASLQMNAPSTRTSYVCLSVS